MRIEPAWRAELASRVHGLAETGVNTVLSISPILYDARVEPSQLLRTARLDAGLTQAQLAARLGVTQPTIAALERPGANPRVRTLERALAATGVRLGLVSEREPAVDESQIADRLVLTPAERLDLFQRSRENLRGLVRGARLVPR